MSWVCTREYELGLYEEVRAGLIRGCTSWVNTRMYELG